MSRDGKKNKVGPIILDSHGAAFVEASEMINDWAEENNAIGKSNKFSADCDEFVVYNGTQTYRVRVERNGLNHWIITTSIKTWEEING